VTQAKDIMTTRLVTASPETPVEEIAQLMNEHKISAVPVVDPGQRLLGIVSGTDLLRHEETGREKASHSWWLLLFNSRDKLARDVIKTRGHAAKDIMTTPAIAVDEMTPIQEIASLFLKRKINQAPVARNGKLVGIVSRGDLVKAIAR
jgi:CBS domain-containing protein